MRALLLAAGKGTRISRYLDGRPKCCIELGNGKRLIEYTIETLRKKQIHDIAVVIGYQHEFLEQILKAMGVSYFFAPFFDVTNSIASAWFAKDFLGDDDILIMNADVFCEEALFDEMLSIKKNPVMFFDSSRIEDADYKFFCPNGIIEKYGKELSSDETTGEYVGIAKLEKNFLPTFRAQLDWMINHQQHSVWWENVLYSLSEQIDIFTYDIAPKFWAEVDYIEDYKRIMNFVHAGYFPA